jgi:Skp family chaperone for outer membrane proteins
MRISTSTGWTTLIISLLFVSLVVVPVAIAQEPQENDPAIAEAERQLHQELDTLRQQLQALSEDRDQQIEALERRIDELEEALRELEAAREQDELADILTEAEQLTQDERTREQEAASQRETAGGRARSLQALNPEISVLGDVSYDWSDSSDIQDRFVLRGLEIAFQSVLDPYTRFKAFLAAHQEPPLLAHEHHDEEGEETGDEHDHEHTEHVSIGVEEIYIEWLALPLNTGLRVGQFRQQFGTLNRWHPHALPSVDIPFALRNLFGHDGLLGLGIGLDWQLPGLFASTSKLTLEVTNADNPTAFAGSDFNDPAVMLRWAPFFDLGPSSYFEFGLSGMVGPNGETETSDTTLGSIDFNFVWEPVDRAKYRGVELRGQYIHSDYEAETETFRTDSFFTYLSWKFARRWIVGVRYDDAGVPNPHVLPQYDELDEDPREVAWSPYLTFWQSEFVRLRAQYQRVSRDFEWEWGPESDNRVYLQVTFAAGPHKHESY